MRTPGWFPGQARTVRALRCRLCASHQTQGPRCLGTPGWHVGRFEVDERGPTSTASLRHSNTEGSLVLQYTEVPNSSEPSTYLPLYSRLQHPPHLFQLTHEHISVPQTSPSAAGALSSTSQYLQAGPKHLMCTCDSSEASPLASPRVTDTGQPLCLRQLCRPVSDMYLAPLLAVCSVKCTECCLQPC